MSDYFSLELMLEKGMIPQTLYEWLIKNGFKKAPASTKYHGAFEGGLYEHSQNVTAQLVYLTEQLNLCWEREISPYIIGMFHDLCKIDAYCLKEEISRDIDGVEVIRMPGIDWTHNENKILEGHGEKSVMLLSQFMTLTEEEMLCIRYHMGAYETENWTQFDLAIKKYPNVLFTHTADMLASKLYT